jgi:signal transduction histidine kinase
MPVQRTPRDCRLLLVDDEEANLDLLEMFLEPDGYTLLRASDGYEAAALLDSDLPDIVLLDLHMPQRSGFDVLRDVQQRTAPGDFLPVIVLTADVSPESRMRALSEGAHDFLTKPLDGMEVRLRVGNLLRTRLLHEEQRRATAAREQVLSVVAHDLRNPLASIAMDAEMLRHLLDEDEHAPQRRAVERIERTTARMHRLIADLLEVTRLHHGTLAVDAEPVATRAMLRDAEQMLHPLAAARGIRLVFKGPADLPTVCVDAGRMHQVFSNLVGNALRFTPPGGTVDVTWAGRDAELVVCVADSGPGIPAEELGRVFSPFWQGARERRGGVGLGLVITRAIVEAHGGRVWLESQVGAGTRAHFTIPLAAALRTPAVAAL